MVEFLAYNKTKKRLEQIININIPNRVIQTIEMQEEQEIDAEYELLPFIGLFDLNGEPIYLGDILKLPKSNKEFIVEYDAPCYILNCNGIKLCSKEDFQERVKIGSKYEKK